MTGDHAVVRRCRVCGSDTFETVVSLGETPLANAFLPPDRADAPEPRYPLEAIRCLACMLMQLSVVVRPEILFRSYLYSSSASGPLLAHFDALADELVRRFAPPGALVVEMGSNDGVLLRPLAQRGVRPLGVEPATNLARAANADGLETWNEFFGSAVASRIREQRGPAAVVAGNNVLAHIDDLHDVVAALDVLLAPDGVFAAEVPYVADLLDHVEYDTIYHEHLSYFGLAPLQRLFADAGLELFDVERLPIHGGSIRLFAGRRGRRPTTARLRALERDEEQRGLLGSERYRRFADEVRASREALRSMLDELRTRGRRVAGLGATAKGNTLLNYCGVTVDDVVFIGDSTPVKQGLLTPGTHIPVRPEEAIRQEAVDDVLLLAWNYADAIVPRYADLLARGGRFIHPIPRARLIAA